MRANRLLSSILLAAGCIHVQSRPIGTLEAPLSPCQVRFERPAASASGPHYREAGAVCVADAGQSPEQIERNLDARAELTERACSLGGNVLLPVGPRACGRSLG